MKFAPLLAAAAAAYDTWSSEHTYSAGDFVTNPIQGAVMVCKPWPNSDFCYLDPNEHGGYTGWDFYSPSKSYSDLLKQVECRAQGHFLKGDLFCDSDSDYVWMCRNNENCNIIWPL